MKNSSKSQSIKWWQKLLYTPEFHGIKTEDKTEKFKPNKPLYSRPVFWMVLIVLGYACSNYVNNKFSEALKYQFYQPGETSLAQSECMAKVVESEISFFGKVRIITGISKTLAEEMNDMPMGKMFGCAFMKN